MVDAVRHIVIDTSILGDFLHPRRTKASTRAQRSHMLLAAAINANWPCLRVYTPAICIAEAIGILDSYRFCTWGKELSKNPNLRLSSRSYRTARQTLTDAVKRRKIEQIEHEPTHVLLAGLISPVNNRFQIRRKKRVKNSSSPTIKQPMGAADCVIVGMAIHLVSRIGRESVHLVTGDQRMADVLMKAERLKPATAETLGLPSNARAAGLEWSPQLYPSSINLERATDRDLRIAFGGWPLPTKPVVVKKRAELDSGERAELINCWLEVSELSGVTNPDSLPYSAELEDIKVRFAIKTSVYLSNECIFRFLLQQRKAKQLPRP